MKPDATKSGCPKAEMEKFKKQEKAAVI